MKVKRKGHETDLELPLVLDELGQLVLAVRELLLDEHREAQPLDLELLLVDHHLRLDLQIEERAQRFVEAASALRNLIAQLLQFSLQLLQLSSNN